MTMPLSPPGPGLTRTQKGRAGRNFNQRTVPLSGPGGGQATFKLQRSKVSRPSATGMPDTSA
jgi:hypothetical protein